MKLPTLPRIIATLTDVRTAARSLRPTITPSSARVVTAGTASRGVVSRVDWPLPAIHPSFRDLSLKGAPVFSFHSRRLTPRRGVAKRGAYYIIQPARRPKAPGDKW